MKIVNQVGFFAMPIGTVYQEFHGDGNFGPLSIFKGMCGTADYFEMEIGEPFLDMDHLNPSGSFEVDYVESRNGLFEKGTRYAVFETADVVQLIDLLKEAASTAY